MGAKNIVRLLLLGWLLPCGIYGQAADWRGELSGMLERAATVFGAEELPMLELSVRERSDAAWDWAQVVSLGDERAATRRGRKLILAPELVAIPGEGEAHAGNLQTRRRYARGVVLYHALRYWDKEMDWSEDRQFRRLTGWAPTWRGWQQLNQLAERSPDLAEWESPAAALAVHGTYFFLDPEYAARVPATFRWLAKRFEDPLAGQHPERNTLLFLTNHGIAADLSPAAIAEVHYLLAAPGHRIESGWGHSLFRLVTADANGEPARTAVTDHLVLGYQALTMGDLRLDHLGGLTGKYPTLVFSYLFTEIYGRYVAGEYRDVRSYPLEYDDYERSLLLDRFLEQYWSYQGAYRFLTRNCASESRDDLSAATGERHRAMTPVGLAKAAAKLGYTSMDLFEDKRAAIADGIYFPEVQAPEDRLRELMRAHGEHRRLLRSITYLERSTAAEREAAIVALAAAADSTSAVVADFYHLETAVTRTAYEELLKEAGKILRRSRRAKEGTPGVETWRLYQEATALYEKMRPWRLVPTRYGVPLAREVAAANPTVARRQVSEELSRRKTVLIDTLREKAPEQWRRHAESKALGDRLLQQLQAE